MFYRTLFPRDLFAELDRLQRELQQSYDLSPTTRRSPSASGLRWLASAISGRTLSMAAAKTSRASRWV